METRNEKIQYKINDLFRWKQNNKLYALAPVPLWVFAAINQPFWWNRQIARYGQRVKNKLITLNQACHTSHTSKCSHGRTDFFICRSSTGLTRMCVARTHTAAPFNSAPHLTNYNDKRRICHVIIFHVRVQFFILVVSLFALSGGPKFTSAVCAFEFCVFFWLFLLFLLLLSVALSLETHFLCECVCL